jgi:hypothetical protein
VQWNFKGIRENEFFSSISDNRTSKHLQTLCGKNPLYAEDLPEDDEPLTHGYGIRGCYDSYFNKADNSPPMDRA